MRRLEIEGKIVRIYAGCAFHRGYKKANNEDNFLFDNKILRDSTIKTGSYQKAVSKNRTCFAVFDGMGGLPAGEQASKIAAETLLDQLCRNEHKKEPDEEWIYRVIHAINTAVACYAKKIGCQIGTTAAFLLFYESSIVVGNIGDSRVYRYENDKLGQLSQDHSDRALIQELGVKGRRPSLLQFVGKSKDEQPILPALSRFPCTNQGRYLVCSDGLTDMLSDKEIEQICRTSAAPLACARALVQEALKKGGEDNITVIVCDLAHNTPSSVPDVMKMIKARITGCQR